MGDFLVFWKLVRNRSSGIEYNNPSGCFKRVVGVLVLSATGGTRRDIIDVYGYSET